MKNIRMKVARIEREMKQEDLAKLVGVTRQTIGLIEAGKYNPSLKTLHCHMPRAGQNVR